VGVIQVTQKDGYQTFCFIYGKLVVCFEVLTDGENKNKERISAWQILSDSAEALANISLPVFLFYFPFRWKLENTFLFSIDHTHFPCTHSLYNQKELFYVKIFKTFNSDVDKFLMWCVISVFLVVFEKWSCIMNIFACIFVNRWREKYAVGKYTV
jgi:hypothetical protein